MKCILSNTMQNYTLWTNTTNFQLIFFIKRANYWHRSKRAPPRLGASSVMPEGLPRDFGKQSRGFTGTTSLLTKSARSWDKIADFVGRFRRFCQPVCRCPSSERRKTAEAWAESRRTERYECDRTESRLLPHKDIRTFPLRTSRPGREQIPPLPLATKNIGLQASLIRRKPYGNKKPRTSACGAYDIEIFWFPD